MRVMPLVRALCVLLWYGVALGQTQPLDAGVEWLPGRFVDGEQPDGNSVLIEAPDGWIVVDSGRHPAHVQALLARIAASGKPLRTIVNTHWHLDHIGGNRALRTAYPQVQLIASDAIVAARSGFLKQYRAQLSDALAGKTNDDAQRTAWQREITVIDDTSASTPDLRVDERITLDLAGRGIGLGLERDAVTGGDVWLYDATAQVVAAGDLVTLPAPLLDTACPERWAQALERLSTLRFRWLVPGHGAPLGRGQFVIYRESFDRLLRCAASTATKQRCIDGWVSDAGGLFPQQQQSLARSLLAYYFDTRLRAPRAAQCRP